MNKFWEWMDKKCYGMGMDDEPTKQMLIGYMMEYLIEKEIHFDIANCYIEQINNSGRSVAIFKTRKITIEDIYKYLEDKIKEVV